MIDFNTQQKGRGIEILTPKQRLQRLPIALSQAKASEISLNEIRQIIYSLYWEKKLLKRYIEI